MPVITVRHKVTTVNLSILKFIFFILRLGSLGLSKIGFEVLRVCPRDQET